MSPSWVVFDIGGVILNWHSCRDLTIKKLGVSLEEFNPVFLKYLPGMELGKLNPVDGFSMILKDLGLNFVAAEIYEYWCQNLTKIIPTEKLINKLSEKYSLAVCTNTWVGVLQKYNIDQYPEIFKEFKHFIDSSSVHLVKPSIEIYKAVEDLIGATQSEIFFIDDSQQNIDGAKLLNWQTHLFDLKDDFGQTSCGELSSILL